MTKHDLVLQIRELLERHLNAMDISHRLNLDIELVQSIIFHLKPHT
jgi:BMFP domain-containing protein YqiC